MSEARELVVIIRPSFMKFCKDGCRAAAFNHILYWIARKARGEPKEKIQAGDVLWYATTEEITEGLANAWGVCKVRQEVNKLIGMGLFSKKSNPTWGVDRTKHFSFGQEQCNTFIQICQKHDICLHRLGLSSDVWHLIKSSFAPGSKLKCVCGQMIDLSDHLINSSDHLIDLSNAHHEIERKSPQANDKSIRAIAKEESQRITTKDDRQREEAEILLTLSSQHQSLFALVCTQKHIQHPTLNEDTKEKVIRQLNDLTAHDISEAEQLRELHEIACRDLASKGKDTKKIFLGNIVNALDEWKLNNTPWNADASTPEPEEHEEMPEPTLEECLEHVYQKVQKNGLPEHSEPAVAEANEIFDLAGVTTGRFHKAIFVALSKVPRRTDRGSWGGCLMDKLSEELGVALILAGSE